MPTAVTTDPYTNADPAVLRDEAAMLRRMAALAVCDGDLDTAANFNDRAAANEQQAEHGVASSLEVTAEQDQRAEILASDHDSVSVTALANGAAILTCYDDGLLVRRLVVDEDGEGGC